MKFGKQLVEQQVPEWSDHYVQYKALKRLISALVTTTTSPSAFGFGPRKHVSIRSTPPPPQPLPASAQPPSPSAQETAFVIRLDRELEGVRLFYTQELSALQDRVTTLVQKRETLEGRRDHSGNEQDWHRGCLALREALMQGRSQVARLQEYGALNAMAFQKILKKWDKRTGTCIKDPYMTRNVDPEPFSQGGACEALADLVESELHHLDLDIGDDLEASIEGDVSKASSAVDGKDEDGDEDGDDDDDDDEEGGASTGGDNPREIPLGNSGRKGSSKEVMTYQTFIPSSKAKRSTDTDQTSVSNPLLSSVTSSSSPSSSSSSSSYQASPRSSTPSNDDQVIKMLETLCRPGREGGVRVDKEADLLTRLLPLLPSSSPSPLRRSLLSKLLWRCCSEAGIPLVPEALVASYYQTLWDRYRLEERYHEGRRVDTDEVMSEESGLKGSVKDEGVRLERQDDPTDPPDVKPNWKAPRREDHAPTPSQTPSPPFDANFSDDITGRTCAHEAALRGRCELLAVTLEAASGIIESVDVYGRRPLHYAAIGGWDRCVGILLRRGADLSSRDQDGTDALGLAVAKGRDRVVQILLSGGANGASTGALGLAPLHLAAREGRLEILRLLVAAVGPEGFEARDRLYGWTAVYYAAHGGHFECLQALLEAGCKARVKDERDRSPVHCAAMAGRRACVELLISSSKGEEGDWESAEEEEEVHSRGRRRARQASTTESTESDAEVETASVMSPLQMEGQSVSSPSQSSQSGEGMPSLALPPPLIPFRMYGHSFLGKGHVRMEVRLGRTPVRMYGTTRLSSLRLVLKAIPATSHPPRTLLLPLGDPTPLVYLLPLKKRGKRGGWLGQPRSSETTGSIPSEKSGSPGEGGVQGRWMFGLEVEVFPVRGTRMIGKAVAHPAVFRPDQHPGERHVVCAIMDPRLRVIGEIHLDWRVVRPYRSSKSTGSYEAKGSGHVEAEGPRDGSERAQEDKTPVPLGSMTPSKLSSSAAITANSSSVTATTTSSSQTSTLSSSLVDQYMTLPVRMTKTGEFVVVPEDVTTLQVPLAQNMQHTDHANCTAGKISVLHVAVESLTLEEFHTLVPLQARYQPLEGDLITEGESTGSMPESLLQQRITCSFPTLMEALKRVPLHVGVNVQVHWAEDQGKSLQGPAQDVNDVADRLLDTLHTRPRPPFASSSLHACILSSFASSLCHALNWKQAHYAVFLCTGAGFDPSRPKDCSLREAVDFARAHQLLGVMCAAQPLIQVPSLVGEVKSAGLLLASYGPINADTRAIQTQEALGVDALLANGYLRYRAGFHMNPLPTHGPTEDDEE